MSSLDDVDSSAADAAKSVQSFEEFARRQFRPLMGLAYALCGDHTVAPELAQEALFAAFRRWDDVRQLDRPDAWVRRVVANRATSTIRRRIVEARGLVRLRSRPQPPPMTEPSADSAWLWALVNDLPRRQRQVLALHYVDQLTLDEVASTLGISKSSANTHLRRAHATLGSRIDEEAVR